MHIKAPSKCGDGIVEIGEQCDFGIGNMNCVLLGFSGGVLYCNNKCEFDTSGCVK